MAPIDDDELPIRKIRSGGESAAVSPAAAPFPAAPADGPIEAVRASAAARAVSPATWVGDLDEVAHDLSIGAMSPADAQVQLIDRVVAAHLPENAPPEMLQQVRLEVGALLEDDPVLRRLLSPSG